MMLVSTELPKCSVDFEFSKEGQVIPFVTKAMVAPRLEISDERGRNSSMTD